MASDARTHAPSAPGLLGLSGTQASGWVWGRGVWVFVGSWSRAPAVEGLDSGVEQGASLAACWPGRPSPSPRSPNHVVSGAGPDGGPRQLRRGRTPRDASGWGSCCPPQTCWETCRPREPDSTGGALEQVPCLCSAHCPRQTRPPPLFVPIVAGVRCTRPYQMEAGGTRTCFGHMVGSEASGTRVSLQAVWDLRAADRPSPSRQHGESHRRDVPSP